jgi:DNA-binding MarR family transcriptional regulator
MSPITPLKSTVGYALAQACKHHRQRAEELLNEIGLHVGQEMLLSGLWENEGITQTELAENVMIQPATVTNMLQRMERGGFVERRPDVNDQRVSRVYTTERGRDMEATVQERWAKLEQEAFDGLNVEERVLLRRLLLQVHRNLAGPA